MFELEMAVRKAIELPHIKQNIYTQTTRHSGRNEPMNNFMVRSCALHGRHMVFSFTSIFYYTICFCQMRKLLQIYIVFGYALFHHFGSRYSFSLLCMFVSLSLSLSFFSSFARSFLVFSI